MGDEYEFYGLLRQCAAAHERELEALRLENKSLKGELDSMNKVCGLHPPTHYCNPVNGDPSAGGASWPEGIDAFARPESDGRNNEQLACVSERSHCGSGTVSFQLTDILQRMEHLLERSNPAPIATVLLESISGSMGKPKTPRNAKDTGIPPSENSRTFNASNTKSGRESESTATGSLSTEKIRSTRHFLRSETHSRTRTNSGLDLMKAMVSKVPHPVHARHTKHREANNIFERIAFHHYFEHFSAAIIVGHAIIIGSYVHYACAIGYPVHPALKVLNSVFMGIFFLEVLIKALAERSEYILGDEYCWNIFDLILVSSVILDLSVAISGTTIENKGKFTSLIKISEMVRTARILRIFKVLRFSYSLSQIISVILSSLQMVVWVLFLLCVFFYVAAVAFTQAAVDFLNQAQFQQHPMSELEESVYMKFGSVGKSLLVTFMAVTGGEDWNIAYQFLSECGTAYGIMFVIFVAMCIFILFNIFVGIFVDAAMQTQHKERSLVAQRHQKAQEELAEILREVFHELDANGSGAVSLDEFLDILKDEEVVQYLSALQLDVHEPTKLFKLLDSDAAGEIEIEQLVQNCIKLKGDAKSVDVHQMIYENRLAINQWMAFLQNLASALSTQWPNSSRSNLSTQISPGSP